MSSPMVWAAMAARAVMSGCTLSVTSVAAGQPGSNEQLDRVDEIGMLMRTVNQSGLNLRALLDDVSAQIEGVSSVSREISEGNRDLSARTEQAASNLEETAASMEQMTATPLGERAKHRDRSGQFS
eukprot:gene26355-47644_t